MRLRKFGILQLQAVLAPVWIDIPVNFQGCFIEIDDLKVYNPAEDDAKLPPSVSDDVIETII